MTYFRAFVSFISYKFYCLFIWKTIPYSVTRQNYKIEFSRFKCNFFHVWKWRNLMFFCFFYVSIWTLFLLNYTIITFRSCTLHVDTFYCCFFLFNLWNNFFLKSVLQIWIFVIPISYCSWNSNYSLNSSIFNKSSTCFNSFEFTFIIWLMIIR